MIRLYQFPDSPFCDKVRRVLHVKGVEHEVENVDLATVAARRLGPTAKVPVLEHDGQRLLDSTDIIAHLERAFPDPPLVPSDPGLAARVHILEDWADESLYFYNLRLRFTFPHNLRRGAGDAQSLLHNPLLSRLANVVVPQAVRVQLHQQGVGRKPEALVVRDLRRHMDALEGWLGDAPFLVGEHLTVADIAVAAQLLGLATTEEGERALQNHPTVLAWLTRIDAATSPNA